MTITHFVPEGPGASYELASVYFGVAVLFLLAGPGRFSLDALLFGKRIGPGVRVASDQPPTQ